MIVMTASDDGPFGDSGADIGVGFSDAAILIVSLLGFVFLAATMYTLVLLRVQSKEEFERAEEEKLDYDEQLERADVSTLNRAQRRQRAQLIMKRQRRLAQGEMNIQDQDGAGAAQDDDLNVDDHGQAQHLSRKERQKAAKAAEREERKLFEEQRRQQQRDAQEAAKREKKERERLEAERVEEERRLRLMAKQAQEQAERDEWDTFMKARRGEDVMTVAEFVDMVEQQKVTSIDSLSERFQRPSEHILRKIKELINSCRLTGVVDGDRFIYITPDEMDAIAKSILDHKQLTLQDAAKLASEFIKL